MVSTRRLFKSLGTEATGLGSICFTALAITLTGCAPTSPKVAPIDYETMRAFAPPPKSQILVLSGSEYPVRVLYKNRQDEIEVDSMSGGIPLEKEDYLDSPAAFSLFAAQEEEYQPALPLIEFPFRVGTIRTWTGSILSSGSEQSANAEIISSQERLKVGRTVHNTVRVDVNLHLTRLGKPPLDRFLRFWFEVGKGLLMRDFGGVSIRKLSEKGM
jgi:hypothetical protein